MKKLLMIMLFLCSANVLADDLSWDDRFAKIENKRIQQEQLDNQKKMIEQQERIIHQQNQAAFDRDRERR